jgi:hypothetical protein
MIENITINMFSYSKWLWCYVRFFFYSRKRISVNRVSLLMHSVVGYATLNKEFYPH